MDCLFKMSCRERGGKEARKNGGRGNNLRRIETVVSQTGRQKLELMLLSGNESTN